MSILLVKGVSDCTSVAQGGCASEFGKRKRLSELERGQDTSDGSATPFGDWLGLASGFLEF